MATEAPAIQIEVPQADQQPQNDDFNIEGLDNPFLAADGGLASDETFETPQELEQAPSAEPEPAPEVDSEPSAEPAAEAPADKKAPEIDLANVLGTPKEEKRKQNKGLREQLRDRNQVVQDLQSQIEEQEKRYEELKARQEEVDREREDATKALTSRYSVGEYDPQADPAVKEIDGRLVARLRQAEVNLGHSGATFAKNWEALATGYANAINGQNTQGFQDLIDEHFGDSATDVKRELSHLNDLISDRANKIRENRDTHYQSVLGSHDQKTKEVREMVDEIGAVPHEGQVEDPLNLNSLISYASGRDDEYKAELDKVKRAVVALTSGVRPFDIRDERWRPYLDDANPGYLTPEGQKIRQQEVWQYEQSQQQLPKKLAEAWAASLLVPRLVKQVSELAARLGDSQESEVEPNIDTELGEAPGKSTEGFGITDDQLDDPESFKNPLSGGLF